MISSSAQIAADISGSLSAIAIVGLGASIVSSSDQIATEISGAFTAPSASISTRLSTAETELLVTLKNVGGTALGTFSVEGQQEVIIYKEPSDTLIGGAAVEAVGVAINGS